MKIFAPIMPSSEIAPNFCTIEFEGLLGKEANIIACDDLPSDSMYPILAFLKAGASISESSLGSDLTCLISETMRPIMRPP